MGKIRMCATRLWMQLSFYKQPGGPRKNGQSSRRLWVTRVAQKWPLKKRRKQIKLHGWLVISIKSIPRLIFRDLFVDVGDEKEPPVKERCVRCKSHLSAENVEP